MKKKRTTFLNASFALTWLDFPVLYYAAVVVRDPLLTAAAFAALGVAALLALAT